MKRALVLSGGGSRGAYECGAWQALEELNIRLDAVYGTSIGALNAALVAQGELSKAVELWENIRMDQVVSIEEGEEFSVERMSTRMRDMIPFLLENARNFMMDITPLENLVRGAVDEARVRVSGRELGMMITRVPQIAPLEVRLGDIPQGRLCDYLIASASCFPVFPIKQIDGERFMDGGYVDNMPLRMAIADGADEIIGIDIHPDPVHPEYGCMPFLTLIHPLHKLGGFLDFNPQRLRRSRLLGYYDTMKAYGRFDGVRYTFTRVNDLRISEVARRYTQIVTRFDALYDGRGREAMLIGALGAETPLRRLSWKETLLRGLELCAQVMGFREDAIYDMDVLTRRLLNFARGMEEEAVLDERGVSEAAHAGSRTLVGFIYGGIRRDADFLRRCGKKLSDYPMELAAALYLVCMEELPPEI